MPLPSEIASNAKANITPEEIPNIVSNLHQYFSTDKTRTVAWRLSQLNALDKLLTEGQNLICKALYEDLHKSLFEGYMQEIGLLKYEIYEAIQHLEEWMEEDLVTTNLFNAPAKSTVQKSPLGVVLVLGAWNYPLLLTLQPVVGAIAAGNCVVIKPPSYASATGKAITYLIQKYMDNEAIISIEGNRHITNKLLEQKFDMMFFTGSPYVGKVVAEAAAKQLCPVILELGGKSPCIITETADIYVSARRIAWGAFMNSGQTCVRPDYFMVHESVADDFINELVQVIKEFYENNPKTSEWYGRIINDSSFKRLNGYLQNDKKYLVYGGNSDEKQKYIEPSIFDFGTDFNAFINSKLMSDEIFGPLLPIIRYNDIDTQVIKFIRERPKPLALYFFTTEEVLADRVFNLTSSGAAVLNDVVVHLSNSNLPFGGVGDSGMGSYHGKKTFDAFTHNRAVLRRTFFIDAPQRYPPYTKDKQAVMNLAFVPQIPYTYEQIINTISDKKNLALAGMGAYIVKNLLSSRL